MAGGDGVFNVGLGRAVELYNRVDTNDPATSALIVVVLKATGLEADATLKDYATLAAILAAANDEATNVNYARKVLTDADLAAWATDNTNNRTDLDLADFGWNDVGATGGSWGKLLVCYDADTAGGTDANITPVTFHAFRDSGGNVVDPVPDGTALNVLVAAAGFFRAS